LKWQALSLSPAEMDFVALKEGAARDIALAFGVPPVLVGLPGDATYANAREAGRALYRQTVLPMAARILSGLSAMLSDWMGEVTLEVDADQLDVIVGGSAVQTQAAFAEAVMGTVAAVIADGRGSELFDLGSAIEVELAHDGQWLESRDDEALANGANLAAIGSELVQFGSAEPLGERRFRLSKLLRGRRGTEWAMSGHAAGERFVLLSSRSLQRIALPEGSIGTMVEVRAHGPGDGAGSAVSAISHAESLRPPGPVNLTCATDGSGGIDIGWTRRSRLGWTWQDGMDTPIGEARESYRVQLTGAGGSISIETSAAQAHADAEAVASLGAGPISVSVVQIGDRALSRAATIGIDL
jgi:hypothetical protein